MKSSPPLPPPLPVGNRQTGRNEWTVELYSAACQLPGGRYAITSRHAPVPSAPSTLPPVSLCSAVVQPVVSVVAIGVVRFASILSPFPHLRTRKGGASLPPPTSTRRGHVPISARPVCGWATEGRDLESLCAHVCGHRMRACLHPGPKGV